jgi:hypothetical protein
MRMRKEWIETPFLPNGVCYKNVMMAIGRSDDPQKAREVYAWKE